MNEADSSRFPFFASLIRDASLVEQLSVAANAFLLGAGPVFFEDLHHMLHSRLTDLPAGSDYYNLVEATIRPLFVLDRFRSSLNVLKGSREDYYLQMALDSALQWCRDLCNFHIDRYQYSLLLEKWYVEVEDKHRRNEDFQLKVRSALFNPQSSSVSIASSSSASTSTFNSYTATGTASAPHQTRSEFAPVLPTESTPSSLPSTSTPPSLTPAYSTIITAAVHEDAALHTNKLPDNPNTNHPLPVSGPSLQQSSDPSSTSISSSLLVWESLAQHDTIIPVFPRKYTIDRRTHQALFGKIVICSDASFFLTIRAIGRTLAIRDRIAPQIPTMTALSIGWQNHTLLPSVLVSFAHLPLYQVIEIHPCIICPQWPWFKQLVDSKRADAIGSPPDDFHLSIQLPEGFSTRLFFCIARMMHGETWEFNLLADEDLAFVLLRERLNHMFAPTLLPPGTFTVLGQLNNLAYSRFPKT
jgi:hypothetical protein